MGDLRLQEVLQEHRGDGNQDPHNTEGLLDHHVGDHHTSDLVVGPHHDICSVFSSQCSILHTGEIHLPLQDPGHGWLMALAPVAFIIIGAVYAWVKRYQSGRPTDLRSMISPNDKWCSAVEDANKSRSGIANVSYVKDSDTIKY